ncbi:MAG: hypothetical protein RL318_2156 [Fibrobacterota bacterium]|jgi:hypothetical protein
MSKSMHLLAILGLGLVGCEAPWDAWPETSTVPPDHVWVTGLMVAGEPFDDISLEAPTSIAQAYDHAAQPCLTGSVLKVVRLDSADTVAYAPDPSSSVGMRVWHPVDATRRVAFGARYRLVADLVRASGAVDHLEADTYTPSFYRLPDSALAPIEALHAHLSVGFSQDSLSRLKSDPSFRAKVWAEEVDLGGMLSARGVGITDFVKYLDGKPVYVPVPRGQDLWYVFDGTLVDGLQLNPKWAVPQTQRYSLSMLMLQSVDAKAFGGLLSTWRFDTAGSVIVNGNRGGFGSAGGGGGGPGSGGGPGHGNDSKVDSARLYPLGTSRGLQYQAKVDASQPWFPMANLVPLSRLSITGKLVYHAYSIDSNAIEHERSFAFAGADGATEVYSNVRGGAGVFAGAARDSFPFRVHAAIGDTYPIVTLRPAWCRDNVPKGPNLKLSAQDLSRLCPKE